MSKIENHTLEKYIVKCMYNSPSSIVEIVQNLKASDFSHPYYRNLFLTIKHLSGLGDVNGSTIMNHLELKNQTLFNDMQKRGGSIMLEKLLTDDAMPVNPPVTEQIEELKQLSYRRKAIEISDKIRMYAENNGDVESGSEFESIEELDEKIKEDVYSLAENLKVKNEISTIGSAVDKLREEIKAGATLGIDLGYYIDENGNKVPYMPKLNRMIKRLRDGALYVFGAPEKTGKSTFMLEIAWHVADKLGIPTLYCDTEMQESEQLLRICSKLSGIEEDRIADNMLDEKEQLIVDAWWEHIKKVPFYHTNVNMLSNSELESRIKLSQLQHGIRLVVYDYVKIHSHQVGEGRPDLILAGTIDTLKEKICKQCQIPVITSGQMWAKNDAQGRGDADKFAETSHFQKLADVICRLDKVNEEDCDLDLLGATHYISLITGRKVRSDLIGTKIGFKFDMNIHKVKEL